MIDDFNGYTVTFCTTEGPFAYQSSKRLLTSAFQECVADHQRHQPNAKITQATIAPEASQLDGTEYWDLREARNYHT